MIDGGEVRLIGTLDTSEIESGQRRVMTGFENVENKSQGTTSSLSSLQSVGSALGKTFATVGTIGVGALAGLAATAPQTAGSLASISASTKQLGLVAGEELAPAFEKAADLFGKFVDKASQEGSIVNTTISSIGSIFTGVVSDIENVINVIDKLNGKELPSFLQGSFTGGDAQSTATGMISQVAEKETQEYKQSFLLNTLENTFSVLNPSELGVKAFNFFTGSNIQGNNPFTNLRQTFFETDTMGGNLGG